MSKFNVGTLIQPGSIGTEKIGKTGLPEGQISVESWGMKDQERQSKQQRWHILYKRPQYASPMDCMVCCQQGVCKSIKEAISSCKKEWQEDYSGISKFCKKLDVFS